MSIAPEAIDRTFLPKNMIRQAVVQKTQLQATFQLLPSSTDLSADGAKLIIRNLMRKLHTVQAICIRKDDDPGLHKRVVGAAKGQTFTVRFMACDHTLDQRYEWYCLLYFLTDLHVDNKT